MTFVHARLRALDTAGVLGRTGSLSRAALVVMFLQELAYQLLAPPVQFPFEFALAHLSGFAGGEEGGGRQSAAAPGRSMRGTPVRGSCTSTVRPWVIADTVPERRANVQKGARLRGTGAAGGDRVGRRPEKRRMGRSRRVTPQNARVSSDIL